MSQNSANKFTLSMQFGNWDHRAVKLEVMDKQRFGLLGKHSMTLARWTAGYPTLMPTLLGQVFTADTRLGEDYNERKTEALGNFLLQLEQDGWEIFDITDLNAEIIYLRKPKTDLAHED